MISVLVLLLLHLISSSAFQPIISLRQCSTHNFNNNKDHGSTITTTLLRAAASNLNKDGKCKFGTKEYWDTMYNGDDDQLLTTSSNDNKNDDGLSAEEYSWYCSYRELQPFWNMLVGHYCDEEKDRVKVLIVGIGNDSTPVQMYDDGWTNMIAFDYSEGGVCRARTLFGPTRLEDGGGGVNDSDDTITATGSAKLLVADCRDIPIPNGSIDATLDKGTLDAIYITGKEVFLDSVKELTRVTATDGVIVCVSAVIPSEELLNAFQNEGSSDFSCCWETLLDGGLAFADGGEATIDLGANLYCFRRK